MAQRQHFKGSDEATNCTVAGFCRNIDISKIIPKEIIFIILRFIFNPFKWHITDPMLIENILNAEMGDAFESKSFNVLKLNCKLRIYPNGIIMDNTFDLFLEVENFPSDWKCVTIACSISISSPQTLTVRTISAITKDSSFVDTIGSTNILSQLRNINPSELTISVNIEILRISNEQNEILYQNPYKLYPQIPITGKLTLTKSSMENVTTFKMCSSNVFSKLWMISLSEDDKFNDSIDVWVQLCHLPFGVSKILVKWKISFIEANKTASMECEFHAEDISGYMFEFSSINEFLNYSQHTLSFTGIILKVWDNHNNIIYSYDPSDRIVDHWNQFVNQKVFRPVGSYHWCIRKKEIIKNILNCSSGEMYTSETFVMSLLEWRISIYPNGDLEDQSDIGSFNVYLELDSVPTKWEQIIVRFTLYFCQTDCKLTAIGLYNEEYNVYGWEYYTLLLSEVKELQPIELIFDAEIEIIRIIQNDNSILYQNPLKIDPQMQINEKWIIDKHLMNKIKNVKHFGKHFSSNVFGNLWVIRLYPHGFDKDNDGKCQLGLGICNLPYNISKLSVKCTISLIEANKETQMTEYEHDVESKSDYKTLCSFQEFINFSQHTVMLSIDITKVYEYNASMEFILD
eukprot:91218_1